MFTSFQISLIEKTGHDHGFEYVQSSSPSEVVLGSALHASIIVIEPAESGFRVSVKRGAESLFSELTRSFQEDQSTGFLIASEAGLSQWMRRASALANSLPNQAVVHFESQVKTELSKLSTADLASTEVQRLVRQRIGQQAFRSAMMNYWGAACAVTGASVPAALRASHAKPWASCISDSERLDVFNGFLLSANLDALFDKFLITFSDTGNILIDRDLTVFDREALGLNEAMSLRWVAPEHLVYLKYHQSEFFKSQ
jgi:putative restriction endonuclease